MIKWVLFDIGETLVSGSSFNHIVKTYQTILKTLGVHRSLTNIGAAYKMTEKDTRRLLNSGKDFWMSYHQIFLRRLKVSKNVLGIAEVLNREWWNYIPISLYPDAIPTLNKLSSKGLELGVVSNGLESDIDHILAKMDLEKMFEIRVGMDTFKHMKPDEEVFLMTLQKLNVLPDEVIFVGDSLENDYESTKKLGMKSILIDRKGKVDRLGIETIKNLDGILRYL